MKPLVIVFVFFFLSYGMAQARYRDHINGKLFEIEGDYAEKLRKHFDEERKIFAPMAVHAAIENMSHRKRITYADIILTKPFPVGVCSNFISNLSPKANQCRAKYTYLIEASLKMSEIIIFAMDYDMTVGEKNQVLEKYTAIMNEINYEIQQMTLEYEKREKFKILGFVN